LSDAQLGGIGYLVSGIGSKAFHFAFMPFVHVST
jgi:hypothetical protein